MSVTVTYLEMLDAAELKAKTEPDWLAIREVVVDQPYLKAFLYQQVGKQWQWTDKLSWSDDKWAEYANDANLRTWIAYQQGSPAGYFELRKHDDNSVEIAYFGLLPEFIGKGVGGALLTEAIKQAWAWQAKRVWVHTCDLDHPSALANYQARGLSVYKTEVE